MSSPRSRQAGMVLVTALLMLIVVTILAVAMFRSFGLDEKIAGNLREKTRALNAAETAEQYAEYWLGAGNGSATSAPITCSTLVPASAPQICTNPLVTPAALPWLVGANPVGVTYLPQAPTPANPTVPTPMNVTTTIGPGSYYATPAFYITFIGASPGGLGKIYQIDAQGFGSSPDTVAVVESTYIVQTGVKDLGSNQ
jgi:type IV pilus assembly protein PilX